MEKEKERMTEWEKESRMKPRTCVLARTHIIMYMVDESSVRECNVLKLLLVVYTNDEYDDNIAAGVRWSVWAYKPKGNNDTSLIDRRPILDR